jgi:hypothetical protein
MATQVVEKFRIHVSMSRIYLAMKGLFDNLRAATGGLPDDLMAYLQVNECCACVYFMHQGPWGQRE